MGFEVGVLVDEETPQWQFQEGFGDLLRTPRFGWYSKLMANRLGLSSFKTY